MTKEIFLVEDRGRTALFAPLRGLIMEVNEGEKEEIAKLINQPQFSFRDLVRIFPEIEEGRLLSKEAKERSPTEGAQEEVDFRPDSAVFFTTFDCNLRCIYCYASAGEKKTNMSRQIAESTIDFIVGNAKSKRQKNVSLAFHGGGEPTMNWLVFQSALSYFQKKARESELTPKISLATNGMLSMTQIGWIAEHLDAVQVSLDGVENIHNFQRPTVGGDGSFTVVYNTVKSFLNKKVQVVIHCVVTEKGIARIPEMVRFLATNFPNTTVHLEPACECGRGLITGQKFPSPELFVKGFIEAEELARPFSVELFYSGAGRKLAEFHKNFCGVSTPNFVVTPEGLVTACHEVAEVKHPLSRWFIYGHLDRSSGSFVFDHQKIRNLRSRAAEIDPMCQECFARFYCAGDCLAKNLSSKCARAGILSNPRCRINQQLLRHYVFARLLNGCRKENSHEHTEGSC